MNGSKLSIVFAALAVVWFLGLMATSMRSEESNDRANTEQMKACVAAGMEWRDSPSIGTVYECVRK